jgi:type VI secretion system protein ImpH
MAGAAGSTPDSVAFLRELAEAPYRYGFFSALRRLECVYRDRPRLGQSQRPATDGVRLGQEPSLAFAPATLSSFSTGDGGGPGRLAVLFLGLFGPNGPLPLHLTEYARNRLRQNDDPTFARFADLFHHRILSLFYRAWADAQPTAQFDRPEADRFALYVGALCGLGMPSLRGRDALPDLAKWHYAGQLAGHTGHAEGLRAMLEGYFGMAVSIEQFIGQWVELPESSRCRLGESPDTGTLGATAIAGSAVWDYQQKFRIVFGPLTFSDYRRLLPGSDGLLRLVALVRGYIGDELAWDVQVVLKRAEVPPLKLGQAGQLGWTTWCAAGPLEEDPRELYLDPLAEGE